MCLGENIRYLRKKNNLSQEDLSDKLGYKSYTTVQKWEMGTSEPPLSKLRELSAIFNVDMDELANENLANPKDKGSTENFIDKNKVPFKKMVPILGRIAAGQPIFAVEEIEGYQPVTDPNIDFALRVQGDSMINARIFTGDLVLVQKDACINNGDIVVALIDDEEATVKRFYNYGDIIVLRPENSTMQEMEFKPGEVRVLGKVKEVSFKL